MKIRFFACLIILAILAACSAAQTNQPASTFATNTLPGPNTPTPVPPTETQIPPQAYTPTSTLGQEIIILTHETPDIILTSANLQIAQNNLDLTQAANQIATLESQSDILKTQLAAASTQAASAGSSSSSSSSTSSSGNYNIPSNVYTVTTTTKAVIYITKRDNDAGYPIMQIYEPRVKFPPGTLTWVYKEVIRADGADYFYQSYDPDGQSELKAYFRLQDIQVRLPSGSPNPFNYPANVAKGEFKEKAVAHYANGYDSGDKPIMEVYEPRIKYEKGKTELLITEFVIATGGSHWYPIYDPDGKPSLYVPVSSVKFLYTWD
ncbi:MAG TPA: hypothetical protein VJ965_09145 [Anaerolineales bacterium]|nr:hypothetical protein [Anaerolineales bacterium]